MYLSDEGICERVFAVKIPQPRLTRTRGYVQSYNMGDGSDRDLFHVTSEVDYRFEADGRKVVLLNPVGKFVYKKIRGQSAEMDNGDVIGDYAFYTGNAFLRALMRDAVT